MEREQWRRRMKRILLNETGQMTVFVALIFQVLFVFFAMVINIGLVVHDKINLQNAVDLGAYYAAERQAEILNEIAHVNYQMRQDYKLLTWRYRVLGTLGRAAPNDANAFPPARTQGNVTFGINDYNAELPTICVANLMWKEALENASEFENYCYRAYGSAGRIPPIPKLPILAPFLPFVDIGAAAIDQLIQNQKLALGNSGPWNWAFATQMMEAYKLSIASRKWVINSLRKNLVAENFLDQNQQPVSQGVLTTIKKNLTVTNLASFEDGGFQMINGLATPACAGGNNDGSPTISEIRTAPTLLYTYTQETGGFEMGFTSIEDTSKIASQLNTFDPTGVYRYFATEPKGATASLENQEGLTASSLGFEKNPWCMAYVGVRAKSHPRKPFAPFGQAVVLEARAFAQPFGGRVGPWYGQSWAAAADMSTGAPVDPLTSPRFTGAEAADATSRLPNYSRYPGDQLGLKAKVAQASTRGLIAGYGTAGHHLSYSFFSDFGQIPSTGDPLAWDSTSADVTAPGGLVAAIRKAESIAIAPDLFDITYYSIDPFYTQNYKSLSASGSRFPAQTVFGVKLQVPPDLGGRNGNAALELFTVANQIQNAIGGVDQTLKNSGLLPYMAFDQNYLLTGWAPADAQNFKFPSGKFGRCDKAAAMTVMIPGGCAVGGRTGYSVRLISRDHLLSNKWAVGGSSESPAAIRNKPGLDF